jgi:hypothetical protein
MRVCDTAPSLSLSLSLSRARRDAGRTEEQMHSSRRLDVLSTSLTLPRSGAQLAGEHRQACIRVHGSSRAIERKERREEEKKRVLVNREGKKKETFFFCVLFARPSSFLETPRRRSFSLSLSLSLSCCTHFHESFFFINRFSIFIRLEITEKSTNRFSLLVSNHHHDHHHHHKSRRLLPP